MEIALAQLDIDPGDTKGNVERAISVIDDAANRGVDLVALPELFHVGYFAFDRYSEAAESIDGKTLSRIRSTAVERGIAILAGSIVEDLGQSTARGFETPSEEGYANTSVLFDSDGKRRTVYRKHHLFGYESAEQELLTPGESLETVDFQGFTIGMTTCYDLRFPELYRDLVDLGATLTLVPSAWPYPRVEHWRLLPRARAVENLMYVATVNGVGTFEEAELLGRSAVYDPWGTVVAGAGDEPTLVTATIDPDRVSERRAEFPALQDRR
jgi:predicted amidohydrolase